MYHFRLIATNASGTLAGSDQTFRTGGLTPPLSVAPVAVTGAAMVTSAHGAILRGTINPAGSTVSYYFLFGTGEPYAFQTMPQSLAAHLARSIQDPVGGLQSGHLFHYRLVAVNEAGETSAGADRTFWTLPAGRVNLSAFKLRISPVSHRRLPATVSVSGRLVPPRSLPPAVACQGRVNVTFKARSRTISHRQAQIRRDCTFGFHVRFSVRRRLLGGHLAVRVVFPGNRYLKRRALQPRSIQIG